MTRRNIIPYSPHVKEYARRLRHKSTKSETLLWRQLKGKQRKGFDFHRQRPIDNYIVDFFCAELMLAIELDGITHDFKIAEDKIRQTKLELLGVRFLRFKDSDVIENMPGVILVIDDWIRKHE